MKTRLSKLLTVKSLVTMTLTIIFSFLAVTGKIPTRDYMTIYTVIISFYFGTQAEKNVSRETEVKKQCELNSAILLTIGENLKKV